MSKRILHIEYIEDNPNNMLLVSRVARSEGHVMLMAENGIRGLQVANRNLPDLIFVDLMLPDINGFEVIRGIRANPDLDGVPGVVLTAYGDAESKRKAEQAGCNGFLRKPVSVHMIRDAIDEFAPEPAL